MTSPSPSFSPLILRAFTETLDFVTHELVLVVIIEVILVGLHLFRTSFGVYLLDFTFLHLRLAELTDQSVSFCLVVQFLTDMGINVVVKLELVQYYR